MGIWDGVVESKIPIAFRFWATGPLPSGSAVDRDDQRVTTDTRGPCDI